MNRPYRLLLTPEQTLAHLTTIASGLAASGHFDLDPELGDVSALGVAVAAAEILRELMSHVEGEINEGDASRYIDAGDARRHFLPGSDNERRKAWLKTPVAKPYEPGSSED